MKLKQFINYQSVARLLLSVLAASQVLFSISVAAQDEEPADTAGYYTQGGKTSYFTPGKDANIVSGTYTPSRLEILFPMSEEAEKLIVHQVPSCPVIIDGITYKADDVALFNGKRLRYVNGPDGMLHAFSTVVGLEAYLAEQNIALAVDTRSYFYTDWLYMGEMLALNPGFGILDLVPLGFNDAISSAKASLSASAAYLYEHINFGGDYLVMLPGSNHSSLSLEGWNDRASSVYVYG